jgi:hypothetical protein
MPPLAVALLVFAVATGLLGLHWLCCRLNAERCPRCGSKWRTELVGEWGGEQWTCHACGHHWETPYGGQ